MRSPSLDTRSAYLELLRRNLTQYGSDELVPVGLYRLGRPLFSTRNLMLVRKRPFNKKARDLGLDWPADALTMIGMQRLTSLQRCVETVLKDDVPGDLVECGVWRGGASILMRAVLSAYGDKKRSVWLCDSFEGVPPPDTAHYEADKGINLHRAAGVLAIPQAQVKANFERYGLLDDQVRFVPGWFKDTLQDAPIERISVLRLDGDLYESTIQALDALYPRLSSGGFCIVDDYHAIDACRQAVADYRTQHGVTAEIEEIDGTGVLWRKP
ncbi:macrocin O-methyltransferase [Mycobacterium mantenii]|uniref:TylF/MycF/NovP-related O-methyltransferase n=1 Tax=Mycobacterium mantenii TaxID=560555 RepID=UPI00080246E3|nr:TylF/MycF/NovP-related O-methyltransferase [Mycobacterium mantenii]OBH47697.1 macrocin O-methyltransferase [Mycobacterium mantenii]